MVAIRVDQVKSGESKITISPDRNIVQRFTGRILSADRFLQHVAQHYPNATEIVIEHGCLTSLKPLKSFRNLKSFKLQGTLGKGLEVLRCLPLTKLEIRDPKAVFSDFSWVPPTVTSLKLSGDSRTNSLTTLHHLTRLEEIAIQMPTISLWEQLRICDTLPTVKCVDLGQILGNESNRALIEDFKNCRKDVEVKYDDR